MKLGKPLFLALALVTLAFAALRVDAAQATITEFSAGLTPGSRATSLVAGPDGSMWFTTYGGKETRAVGRITPDGVITEFRKGLDGGFPQSLVAGPDGNMWFGIAAGDGSGPAIGRITPAGEITRFAELAVNTEPEELAVDPAGRIWWVSSSGSRPGLGYVKPSSGLIVEGSLPGWPSDIAAGPDGNMWLTYGEGSQAAIVKVETSDTPGSVKFTYYRDGLREESEPRQIILGPDGNLWFTDPWVEAIGKVTPAGTITEFSAGYAEDIVAGPDGNVWFSDWGISRITPAGEVTYFSPPGAGESRLPRDLAVGPDGNIWFASAHQSELGNGAIGRITPLGQAEEYNVGLNPGALPWEIALGADGNLWFADLGEPTAIGRATLAGNGFKRRWEGPFKVQMPPPTEQFQQFPPIPRVLLDGRRIVFNSSGVAAVRLICVGTLPCGGALRAVAKKRGWRADRRIGAGSFSIAGNSSEQVRLRLNRQGRALLREAGGKRPARIAPGPGGPLTMTTYPVTLISRG